MATDGCRVWIEEGHLIFAPSAAFRADTRDCASSRRDNGTPKTHGPTDARERAARALRENPDASLTAVAKAAGVSRGTVVNAGKDLTTEARKAARRESRATAKAAKQSPERRQRAQQFLRDALANCPKRVSDLEEQAVKAHIDEITLGQARADLGILTTRANTGGAQAVQWQLPG